MATVISGTTGISANAVQFLIGQVIFMAGANAPSGFLKCNGQLVSRTTYASLFAVIGTTYGAGNGSTTFAVPDLRGEFIRGWDDGRGVDTGRAIGSAQASQNLSHNHGGADGAAGGHSHTLHAGGNGGYPWAGVADGQWSPGGSMQTNNVGNHQHGISSDGGAESRPRNVAMLACIFTGV